jgi:hypothetical protein
VFGGNGFLSGAAVSKKAWPEYIVDPEHCVVCVRFGRKLDLDDIELYARSLVENPLFQPTFAEIVDLTAVEELQLNAEAAVSLADQIDPFSLDSKRAFIARSPSQINAARMHQILWSEKSIKIFASEASAREWLQIP